MENVRELALDILLELERGEEYSNKLIKSVLDKYDYLDAREKAFVKRVSEGTLERRLELDYYLNAYSSLPVRKMRPLIRCLMRMSVYQLLYMDSVPDSAVCNEACKLAGKRGFRNLRGFVNGLLRTVAREKGSLPLPDRERTPLQYLSVRYSMPEWLVELWTEEYGMRVTERLLAALLEKSPVSLRFSIGLSPEERETLCRDIRGMGACLTESSYLPFVYRMEQGENVSALPGFSEGKYTVQDVSSALAVELAGIDEEDFVIDVCAAPGGKSILAAERAQKGRVLARDISEEKTALIAENVWRMGIANLDIQVFDGTKTDEVLVDSADVVLLDVPCSGLGVIGKKGDIKYRASAEGMKSLVELQRSIVRASACYVKPGGTLVYSTCTIHSEENEAMVDYIVRELGFQPVSIEEMLPEVLREHRRALESDLGREGRKPRRLTEDRKTKGLTEERKTKGFTEDRKTLELTAEERKACVLLMPGYMESDGFFIARFRREKGQGSRAETDHADGGSCNGR